MAPVQVVDDDEKMMDDSDDRVDLEQKLINEEYKTWKKNSPFLYDMILGTALSWPTLTVQWFPDVKDLDEKNYRLHRLLLGTHTSKHATNYLQIADVQIPKSVSPDPADYDEDLADIGGYGGGGKSGDGGIISFEIVQKIEHPGEINKARYQPQNPDLIATLCIDGRILIFDRTKHPRLPPTAGPIDPQLELIGHKMEGFGLCWSPHEEGCLASGSEDTTVLLWDLKDVQSDSKTLKPARIYTHHDNVVNDVQYHPMRRHLIGTVSDDITVQVIDTRQATTQTAALVGRDGHMDAINSLAFSPSEEVLMATGSADKTIGIWDLRNLKDKIHTLEGHVDAVTGLSWHPHEAGVLSSISYDRRVIFWDLCRVGEEQLPDDQDDGSPELLFMHGGHTGHLSDFSWNMNEPWLACSAAEDNLLQIWKVSDAIVGPDDSTDIRLDELDR